MRFNFWHGLVILYLIARAVMAAADDHAVALPPGVQAVWDLDKAHRETTPTREQICINGLWRWQPAAAQPDQPPDKNWGHFKVPGCWPGITNYMQKDSQTVFAHPSWQDQRLSGVTAAWYEREIAIPAAWTGRRITLSADCVDSLAIAYVDGRRAGELRFPGGELDLTPVLMPSEKHVLSLHVTALPLRAVMLSYSDSNAARAVQGSVARRGLCGDVFLASEPQGPRVSAVKVDTSVRRGEITFAIAAENLDAGASYTLAARITSGGNPAAQFSSPPFSGRELRDGRFAFTQRWLPDRLWDIHTPQNTYEVSLSLLDAAGRVLDMTHPQHFGFREFWIDGRDFYLNGSRIFLSALPLDNAQVGAALASYDGAKESLLRLKSSGINFVYTHNYGCQPGDHLSFAEILRAADDVGMLVALSQPHFSHYDWQAADAEQSNGYAGHAEYYVGVAGNHPAVVAYSTSHNACGYGEDMNPDLIDGIQDPRKSQYELNNRSRALRAEAIIRRHDPGRIVYHHAGGNTGVLHAMNFYPNFVPIQEMSDWFEHWATTGVKPVFLCEYGAPFAWDWAMYRGWYQGQREFGSARVPWDFCAAEWNAQFFGPAAYKISEFEKANLRWEARQFQAGRVWNRWDYPHNLNSPNLDERFAVYARYITDNWRAFRTWGVSAHSPWEHGQFWKLKDGVERGRQELPVDWQNLQRPGFSPDYQAERYERMDLAYEPADWQPTAAAEALLRNNGPLLAYIAGKPAAFTSRDHIFLPGETVEKQLIVINNSRRTVTCDCSWMLNMPQPVTGSKQVTLPTGEQTSISLVCKLPAGLVAPAKYELRARFKFSNGETQEDAVAINVLPPPRAVAIHGQVALFDPAGETAKLLDKLAVRYQRVDAAADLAGVELLIIGKGALTPADPAPDISRVRDGLKVIVFEQTAEALEKRLGFRVTEYGLREVFARVPDHRTLTGLNKNHLTDWRGSATLVPPRLTYELRPRYGPTIQWCGIPVPRLWRCGNRGNVASVLIEKPACGDFLPILDGGYALQYSPLLEHRSGKGMILFCQIDVTGRTEDDPAADTVVQNLLQYAAAWKPAAERSVMYVGEAAGKRHLEACGIAAAELGELSDDQILVVGPGGGQSLADLAPAIQEWLRTGGRLLTVGLEDQDLKPLALLVTTRKAEHIAAFFDAPPRRSPFAGTSPADVHNRDPRELALLFGGAATLGNGVLAASADGKIVFCQLAPWQFANVQQLNHKKTYRRTSFLLSRLLANLGVASSTPIVERFSKPVDETASQQRWLKGLYLDVPEEWDDPYRHFRW